MTALAEGERSRTIFELMNDPGKLEQLSGDGRIRIFRTGEILSRAVQQVGRCSLRGLVEQTWMALGGPSLLRESSHLEDAQTYLDLIEGFEQGGIIRDFSLLDARLEFLFAKPLRGTDCVKVMTVHSAKGLEFDTVILPGLGAVARSNERELLIWTEELTEDGSARLHVAAQPRRGASEQLYEDIKTKLRIKEGHEIKRLFYVAATRAKNRLYLLGNVKSKAQGNDVSTPGSNTFLRLIWPAYQVQFQAAARARRWRQASLFEGELRASNALRRLPEAWRRPRLDASVSWQPEVRRATASARTVAYEWVSDTGRHIGTVVHAVLKRMSMTGGGPIAAAVVRLELLRLGVARTEVAAAAKQVMRAVTNTLGSEKGRWILAPHAESQSEWAIGGRIGERLIAGTVDRAFRDETGRLWIVDYKTSEHEGADLNDFLEEEERRYRPQLESYAVLVSRLLPGPISLGLYFPLLDAWREWAFEEELTGAALYTGT